MSQPTSLPSTQHPRNVSLGADPRMPPGSWDSHLHIMDPVRYPPVQQLPYKQGVYNIWDNAIFERSIGCEHVVWVQSSTHGNDLTLMLDSLKSCGNARAYGVALFDPKTVSHEQLREWNRVGIRGVRVNLVTLAQNTTTEDLKIQITHYVDLIKSYDWVLQLYVKMDQIAELESFLPTLGVRVAVDHYGDPVLPQSEGPIYPYDIGGFGALVRLLQNGTTWVKISGAYRLSQTSNSTVWEDVDPVTLELFKVAPERVVFGSDWPHTRYDGLDIRPWVSHLLDLTEGQQKLRENLFRNNAQELWGVEKLGCQASK